MSCNIYNSILNFDKLCIKVRLGLSQEERQILQEVFVSVKLYFPTIPHACTSDEIEDTICYHTMTELIKEYCLNKEFKLIEFLTYQLYQLIKKEISPECKIWLKLEKYPTMMVDLKGPVSFIYHDLE